MVSADSDPVPVPTEGDDVKSADDGASPMTDDVNAGVGDPEVVAVKEKNEFLARSESTFVVKDVHSLFRRNGGRNAVISPPVDVYEGVKFITQVFMQSQDGEYVGIYLRLDDGFLESIKGWDNWSISIGFGFEIVNFKDPKNGQKNYDTRYTFYNSSEDRGFAKMLEHTMLCDSGFLNENEEMHVITRVDVRLLTMPHPIDRLSASYDSHKEIGIVGIENQSATCYMNSFLQSLFCLPAFVRAVYKIPTEKHPPEVTLNLQKRPLVPDHMLALQHLFYDLQTSTDIVKTRRLTDSFHWTEGQIREQQDVNAFREQFFDIIEERMKDTEVKDTFERLFEFTMVGLRECVDIDFKREKFDKESCLRIYLDDNSNGKSLEDLLEDVVKPEILDGENQWRTDEHGLQKAQTSITYRNLPPILTVSLGRFDKYTLTKKQSVIKYSNSMSFAPIVQGAEPNDPKYDYNLHSVCVHRGVIEGGHYMAYIRPDAKSQWYCFNDEKVVKVDDKWAIDNNFGGNSNLFSAYMLVYIRKDQIDAICQPPMSIDDVPKHLVERFSTETTTWVKRRELEADQLKRCNVNIVTVDELKRWKSTEMLPSELVKPIRLYKDMSFEKAREEFAKVYGIPADRQFVFRCNPRQNGSIRPNKLLPESQRNQRFDEITQSAGGGPSTIRYFLIMDLDPLKVQKLVTKAVPHEYLPQPKQARQDGLLGIIKWFDREKQELSCLGAHFYDTNDLGSSLYDVARRKMGLPEGTEIEGFEEEFAAQNKINTLDPEQTCKKQSFVCGDIFVFQVKPSEPTPIDPKTFEDPRTMPATDLDLVTFLQVHSALADVTLVPYNKTSLLKFLKHHCRRKRRLSAHSKHSGVSDSQNDGPQAKKAHIDSSISSPSSSALSPASASALSHASASAPTSESESKDAPGAGGEPSQSSAGSVSMNSQQQHDFPNPSQTLPDFSHIPSPKRSFTDIGMPQMFPKHSASDHIFFGDKENEDPLQLGSGDSLPFLQNGFGDEGDFDHPMDGVAQYNEKRGGFSSPTRNHRSANGGDGDGNNDSDGDEKDALPTDGVRRHKWSDQVTRGRADLRKRGRCKLHVHYSAQRQKIHDAIADLLGINGDLIELCTQTISNCGRNLKMEEEFATTQPFYTVPQQLKRGLDYPQFTPEIYFKVRDFSKADLEASDVCHFYWRKPHSLNYMDEIKLLIPKRCSYDELSTRIVEHLQAANHISHKDPSRLRFYFCRDNMATDTLTHERPSRIINDDLKRKRSQMLMVEARHPDESPKDSIYWVRFAKRVHDQRVTDSSEDRLVSRKNRSLPFSMLVKQEDKVSDVFTRTRQHYNIPEAVFASWIFYWKPDEQASFKLDEFTSDRFIDFVAQASHGLNYDDEEDDEPMFPPSEEWAKNNTIFVVMEPDEFDGVVDEDATHNADGSVHTSGSGKRRRAASSSDSNSDVGRTGASASGSNNGSGAGSVKRRNRGELSLKPQGPA